MKRVLRRMWHVLGGLFFPTLAFFVPHLPLMIGLGVITALMVAFEVARLTHPGFNAWLGKIVPVSVKEREAARPTGTTYLLIGTLITLGLFRTPIAITALYFSALGDPAAAFAGEAFGRTRIGRKSLEGAAAGFITCVVVGFLLSFYSHLGMGSIALAALVASAIELLPIPLDDNMTMPIGASLVLAFVRL